jgi:hypothetical protein
VDIYATWHRKNQSTKEIATIVTGGRMKRNKQGKFTWLLQGNLPRTPGLIEYEMDMK